MCFQLIIKMKNTILIVTIIFVLFVAGCQQSLSESEPEPSTPAQQTQTTSSPPAPPETLQPTCEEWATELVPKYVTVHEGAGSCERRLTGVWGDGEQVKLIGRNIEFTNNQNIKFVIAPGKEIGEDPARYYIRAYNGEIANLGYQQEVRNSEGVIIGYNKFTVKVNGYERIDSGVRDAEGIGCVYYDYWVNDFTITDCVKVTE